MDRSRCYEHLQSEIAKAFAIPAHLLSAGPDYFQMKILEAHRSTEAMRAEYLKLYLEYSSPRWLIHREEQLLP